MIITKEDMNEHMRVLAMEHRDGLHVNLTAEQKENTRWCEECGVNKRNIACTRDFLGRSSAEIIEDERGNPFD